MAKIIIVYQSQHGFTQQFAMWLAKGLHAELIDAVFVTAADFSNCEIVVYGGHVINHRVAGAPGFFRRFGDLLPPAVVVFGTGVMPMPASELQRVRAKSFRKWDTITPELYYLRGHKDLTPLPLRIRLHLKLQAGGGADGCGQKTVQPVIEAVQRLQGR